MKKRKKIKKEKYLIEDKIFKFYIDFSSIFLKINKLLGIGPNPQSPFPVLIII